ncbi:MAG: GTPase Era [Candidatus Eisenbacteria bacterium]|uniref:GTPase Era n=1 Tax=Eiseniibacteriota bacterium TaxID=2212470 RepID=A0A948RYQ9_UNCEI|nr:GTPase Era [Candidatus Eisenbacteria bacterium]MBU1948786.1 GTPase Era [Candidatus Eisenbacteria bacterium]MBU2692871.1 GTPase Era [Candidatus Eisenbacteria bacterium]
MNQTAHRSGYVAIAGIPNAGKSTLLNALVKTRLAAVTPKPQTTRRRTLGILSADDYQMIFVDTPGVLRPRDAMEVAMERVIHQALDDADVVLYLVDATHPRPVPIVEEKSHKKTTVVALNKVDELKKREDLLPVIDRMKEKGSYKEFIPISALKGTNLDLLVKTLVDLLPEGPAFYPADHLTEQPEKFFVAELIREQIFLQYRQEIPYGAEVIIEEFHEHQGRKDVIKAMIIVESDSQKGILIGKGGREIKKLGIASRETVESFLERPVFLELRVKTMAKWRKDPKTLKRLGYS